MSEIPSQNKVNVGLKFATTDLDKQVDTALLKQLVDGRSKRGGGGGENPLTINTIEEETSSSKARGRCYTVYCLLYILYTIHYTLYTVDC